MTKNERLIIFMVKTTKLKMKTERERVYIFLSINTFKLCMIIYYLSLLYYETF